MLVKDWGRELQKIQVTVIERQYGRGFLGSSCLNRTQMTDRNNIELFHYETKQLIEVVWVDRWPVRIRMRIYPMEI